MKVTFKKIIKGMLPYGIIWLYKNHKEKIFNLLELYKYYKWKKINIANGGGGYYDHILTLYPNCEPAFQFHHYFGFVESGLFTWCASGRFDGFIKAIENPDVIFSDGVISHLDQNNMLECKETGLNFHGNLSNKELLDDNGNYDNKKIDVEYANIIARVKHLVEKWNLILGSNDTQLYILACNEFEHKFNSSDIDKIYNILKSRTKNVSLLVIIKRIELYNDVSKKYHSDKNVFVKNIHNWTPMDKVTTIELSDEKGWVKILKCFKTRSLNQDDKKYKFNK